MSDEQLIRCSSRQEDCFYLQSDFASTAWPVWLGTHGIAQEEGILPKQQFMRPLRGPDGLCEKVIAFFVRRRATLPVRRDLYGRTNVKMPGQSLPGHSCVRLRVIGLDAPFGQEDSLYLQGDFTSSGRFSAPAPLTALLFLGPNPCHVDSPQRKEKRLRLGRYGITGFGRPICVSHPI
jgi:hypothetical protein